MNEGVGRVGIETPVTSVDALIIACRVKSKTLPLRSDGKEVKKEGRLAQPFSLFVSASSERGSTQSSEAAADGEETSNTTTTTRWASN